MQDFGEINFMKYLNFFLFDQFAEKVFDVVNIGEKEFEKREDRIFRITFKDLEGFYRFGLIRRNKKNVLKDLWIFCRDFDIKYAKKFLRLWDRNEESIMKYVTG